MLAEKALFGTVQADLLVATLVEFVACITRSKIAGGHLPTGGATLMVAGAAGGTRGVPFEQTAPYTEEEKRRATYFPERPSPAIRDTHSLPG